MDHAAGALNPEAILRMKREHNDNFFLSIMIIMYNFS